MSILTSIPQLNHPLVTAQRAAEIVSALVRFGFGEFVRGVGLDSLLPGSTVGPPGVEDDTPAAVRIRLLLEDLGPTFIKAGQFMSTRPDLVPAGLIDELAKLQSKVPPAEWAGDRGVEALLRQELGERYDTAFQSIDSEALAAASVAQVHCATLANGDEVVLKVLRPGTRRRMEGDLALMRGLSKMAGTMFDNVGVDLDAVLTEFARQLERETDLQLEARSTQRMGRELQDDDRIAFAKVYPDLCTRSVLTMQRMHGTLLANLDLDETPEPQRNAVVKAGVAAVFHQTLVAGFFHADPHAGNLMRLNDGRLCFLDCGMTGMIDPGTADQLAKLVQATLKRDLDRVVKAVLDLADADPALGQDRALRADAWRIIDRFHAGDLESIGLGNVLGDFFQAMQAYKLRCPADIVYLIKAMATIEGVAQRIAPGFDLIAQARPYIERLVRERYSFGSLRQRFEQAALSYGDLIENLPDDLRQALRVVQRNELTLKLNHEGLEDLTGEIEHAGARVSWSVGIASIILGAALLILADSVDRQMGWLSGVGAGGLIAAGVLAGLRLVATWRHQRSQKD
ncbi:MAG: AarF/UbiB family protein [Planctomycetota bacterium]